MSPTLDDFPAYSDYIQRMAAYLQAGGMPKVATALLDMLAALKQNS